MALNFAALWDAYPGLWDDENPCRLKNGHMAFENQCAIRLGTALAKCGYDVTQLPVHFCWHHPKSAGHILRAEELANALRRKTPPGVFPVVKVEVENFDSVLRGTTGIIFFKDFWQRNNESFTSRSGDHIDLWNGTRLKKYSSYFRIQFGLHWSDGGFSDYFDSNEIWFWRIL